MSKKILVVFGATGQQGGSVINTVFKDAELRQQYHIRAVTRDLSKYEAQVLSLRGVELVRANVDDKTSLQHAMRNSHTVFAMTESLHDEDLKAREIRRGRNLVDAAVASGVQFFIYSTVPSIFTVSGGKYTHADHFDCKAEVEEYIRAQPIKSAFVAPGFFMQFYVGVMGVIPVGDGTYAIQSIITPQAAFPLLEVAEDTGKFVGTILADPEGYQGKVVAAASGLYSMSDIANIMSSATGKTIRYHQLSLDQFSSIIPLPPLSGRIVDMMLCIQEFGYYGPESKTIVEESVRNARGTVASFESFMQNARLNLQ